MGFYDKPLVISGDSWSDLTSGENQLYSASEQYLRSGGDPQTNPFLNQKGFYTDPNTGNIYENKSIDFETGQVKYTPYLNLDDIKGDYALELKANYLGHPAIGNDTIQELRGLIDLKKSNPQEYQKASASLIGDMAFNLWQGNSPYAAELVSELEKIKDVNPEAYYAADIALTAKQMGHNAANGAPDRNAPMQQDLQNIYGEAVNSGLSPEFINQTINQNYQTTAANRAKTNATNAASGGAGFNFKTDMLPGLKLVGSALLGAYGAEYLGAAGAAGESSAAAGELAGPTYAELGYTGIEGGFAGPTYAEMGYTGLNNAQAIAAADAAAKGLTFADALKYADTARKALGVGNTLSKLLGGGAGGASGAAGTGARTSPEQIASYLRNATAPVQTNDYLGQIKMNQNPFTFTSPGQTMASEGMYDVSGSNLANALRKA
jgi:hypothetical protein